MKTIDRLKKVIVNIAGIDIKKITKESSLADDLDIDSLWLVELGMAIEDEFDIRDFLDGDLAELKTVGNIVKYLDKRRK